MLPKLYPFERSGERTRSLMTSGDVAYTNSLGTDHVINVSMSKLNEVLSFGAA